MNFADVLLDKITRLSILIFILASQPVLAQQADPRAPIHDVDGSFAREWLVLGPFPGKGLETDFLKAAGGETNIRPKEGDTVVRGDGTRLSWTRLRGTDDKVNLEVAFGIQELFVAYAYCELVSDQPGEIDVRASCSGYAASMRLNGLEPTPLHAGLSPDIQPVFPIKLQAGRNACLLKLAISQSEPNLMFQPLPPERALADLTVTDQGGKKVAGAQVRFYEKGETVARLNADDSGRTVACLYPLSKSYDIQVTSGSMGTWLFDLALQPGERRKLAVPLSEATSISGRVLSMNGSPQAAIVVEALLENPRSVSTGTEPPLLTGFTATSLTDSNGFFSFVNLRPGGYRVRCHGPDGFHYAGALPGADGNAADAKLFAIVPGREPERTEFVIPEVKKGVWKNFIITQGLVELEARVIDRTPDGLLWVGSSSSSLFALEGIDFKMIGATKEIPGDEVLALAHGPDDALWIGASSGVSRSAAGRTEIVSFVEKLARSQVNAIHVDADGTVWFATASGLAKYDGRQWVTYSVKDGLPSNLITALARTRDGSLCMLTETGLVRFDGQSFTVLQSFSRLGPHKMGGSGNPRSVTGSSGRDGRFSWLWNPKLFQAKDGSLWFGTQFDGAYRYDGKIVSRLGREHGLLSDYITGITQTSDESLWFGTPEGISRFDGATVVNYTEKDGLINRFVTDLYADPDDVLWCATRRGVSRFDGKGFIRFTKMDGICNDEGGTVGVLSLEPDPDGSLWIGSEWGGLFRIRGLKIESITPSPEKDYVRKIYRSADDSLWFGMSRGIYKYENGKVVRALSREWVLALSGDDQGNLWYGQGWLGGGLSRFNPKTGAEIVFTKTQGLPDDAVWAIEWSPTGELWVGTSGGLARYHEGKIENLREKLGIPTGAVYNLRRDASDTLWIGSKLGLHRLEPVGKPGRAGPENSSQALNAAFKRISITVTNGLPDQHIWCSARTSDGIIWMGTDRNGLLGYDGKAITVLDTRDGLQGNQVIALATNGGGALWVGARNGGLVRYQPGKTRPSVQWTSVKLDDQTLTNFSKLSEVETGHRVTVQYREIDQKTHPDKRQFWYRLLGSSGETLFAAVTKERNYEWTPHKAGTYAFEVQAIDRDLNYSEPARLTFRVTVPWFANAWILAPAGATFAGLFAWAFVARALYLGKQRESSRLQERLLKQESQAREALEKQNRQLEEAKAAAEDAKAAAEKAKDIAEMANHAKSTFLANMSHEIRTPLNAILGFSEILIGEVQNPKLRSHLTAISSSGNGLLTIINDILDLSKIEAGRLNLQYEPISIRPFLTEVAEVFSQKIQEKGLRLEIEIAKDLPQALLLDEVRLRQILFNVVGNAVKFTENGFIRLSAASKPSNANPEQVDLSLTVADSGIGILPEDLSRIFESFTQASGQSTRKYGGTGLGLAITKRLTEMLGGTVRVESEVGKGSRFEFEFKGVAIASAPAPRALGHQPALTLSQLQPSVILLAEDHPFNRSLLAAYFEGTGHRLVMAANGREAIELARKEKPGVILMDIRMPEMSGWEAARILKSDPQLKSTPIIVITASTLPDEASQHASLHDRFLRKPVSKSDLVQALAEFLPHKPTRPELHKSPGDSIAVSSSAKQGPRSPELISLLDNELQDVWPGLSERPNIAQIKKFALRLARWAELYEAKELAGFAQSLHEQADQFDLDRLGQSLRQFPEIRQSLASGT